MRSSLLLLAACGYEAPLLEDPSPENVIAGEVVVSGVETASDVMLLLFDAADPGPPAGTGSPLTFTTVPAEAFTGAGVGLQGAPYSFTGLPDGRYLVQGLMDVDGDFNPFEGTTAGSTCGDVVGGHLVSTADLSLAPVTVEDGQLVEQEILIENITRIRDVEIGLAGELYLLLEHASGGQIVRVTRAPPKH